MYVSHVFTLIHPCSNQPQCHLQSTVSESGRDGYRCHLSNVPIIVDIQRNHMTLLASPPGGYSIFPRGSKMIAPQCQLVLFINILIYWFGNIIINQVDFNADQKTDFLVQMEPFFLFGPLFLIFLLCWWNYIEAGEQTTSKEITFQECNDCSLKSMIGRCTFYI